MNREFVDQAIRVFEGRKDLLPHYARCKYKSYQIHEQIGKIDESMELLSEALSTYRVLMPDVEVNPGMLSEAVFDEVVPYDAK